MPRHIAPLHLHHHDDDAWYVLQGVLCVRVGEEIVEARVGSAVLAPRGMADTYWNPGREQTSYLLVMTFDIHRLIPEIHKLTDRDQPSLEAVCREYDSELL